MKNLNLMRVIEKGFYDVYVRYEHAESQSSHKSQQHAKLVASRGACYTPKWEEEL